jgi:hypothetical protein
MITDCSRQVNLSFSLADDEGRKNSLAKARLLRDELSQFVDALEDEALFAEKQEIQRQKHTYLDLVSHETLNEYQEDSLEAIQQWAEGKGIDINEWTKDD